MRFAVVSSRACWKGFSTKPPSCRNEYCWHVWKNATQTSNIVQLTCTALHSRERVPASMLSDWTWGEATCLIQALQTLAWISKSGATCSAV